MSTAKDLPPHCVVRDTTLPRIKEDGRYVSRSTSGATQQNHAANAVSRFEVLFGVKLAP